MIGNHIYIYIISLILILILIIQKYSRKHFSNNNCHIVCSICMEKIPDYVIANATPSEFTSFLKAREEVAIKSVINDYELKINRLRVELEEDIRRGNEESSMILKHCNHIIEEIITLKCPRQRCCATIVFPPDFSNCFALTCDTCGCGFCAWCFLDCGNDAHHHVPGCRPGLEPRGLFPPGIVIYITIIISSSSLSLSSS